MSQVLSHALRERVIALAGAMRSFGVPVAASEEIVAFEALLHVDIGDGEDFRLALRAALCRHRDAQDIFDQLYPRWLRGGSLQPDDVVQPPTDAGQAGAAERVASRDGGTIRTTQREGTQEERQAERSRYSPSAASGSRAAEVSAQQPVVALREADVFLASLRVGVGRRFRAGSGPRIDLRRSLHAALANHGEVLRLERRRRKPRPPRVVLLCDGSRSMERESAGILRVGRALLRRSRRAEVFLFSTQLRRVTRQLRRASGAAPSLRELGEGFGGGTRIGGALQTLVREYGRLLSRDSVVLIASDGLDTGDVELLAGALAVLRSRCAYVFWLNPLAGTEGFLPEQRAMKAALPYIDLLWDMHDPHALSRLARRVREGRISA